VLRVLRGQEPFSKSSTFRFKKKRGFSASDARLSERATLEGLQIGILLALTADYRADRFKRGAAAGARPLGEDQ